MILAASLLAGCANAPHDLSGEIQDPNEAGNRVILNANQAVLAPFARGFHSVVPPQIRNRLSDFDNNLKEPRILANDLLQLRLGAAAKTAGRFVINSTIGVGGLVDVASQGGLPQQTGDFGQTLFVWGFRDGPYLVLPFFGPSTTRDAVGLGVDLLGDPLSWALTTEWGNLPAYSMAGLDFVTQVDQLKQAEASSIDFYSFLRSSYYQTRRNQLREAIGLPPVVETPGENSTPPLPPPRAPVRTKHRAAR